VRQARRVAEAGARKAIEQLAVHHHEPWSTLTPEQRKLRNRLRAHGRPLGDKLDPRTDRQEIGRLAHECAYEHWHRMLFARFLAENNLLIEPQTGVPITLEECRELALEHATDWLTLASEFAVRMLPQIFRSGDPVLEIILPPETRQELEQLLKVDSLPSEMFLADDSLGWVYQFWQAERKDEVNRSEKKIGADELPAVTQLFTEDYMVLFLLHNTLGAWWAGKVLAAKPELATSPKDEEELRRACSVNGYEWTYLRFVRDDEQGNWRPAAGAFEGWPGAAKQIKVLDPCMGSGHFLVFALPILADLRMEEEGLTREQAVEAVLRDNLFGLEIDPRCTQIAAFNLALAAWRMVGYRPLPPLNLACSGLRISAKQEEWLKLAGYDGRLREAMRQLYAMFRQAPTLGSLIDPRRVGGDLFVAEFEQVQRLLEEALSAEQPTDDASELAVVARGLMTAAKILVEAFILVATNVPYLGRKKQDPSLAEYCSSVHSDASSDLATCFLDRCIRFCASAGSAAAVTPHNWLFLTSYKNFRKRLLKGTRWQFVTWIGEHGFDSPQAAGAFTALVSLTRASPSRSDAFLGLDVSDLERPDDKATALRDRAASSSNQEAQLSNPDHRIVLERISSTVSHLEMYTTNHQGLSTGDSPRFRRSFWEVPSLAPAWEPEQSTVESTELYGGRSGILLWEGGKGELYQFGRENVQTLHNVDRRGEEAWARKGVAIAQMRGLPATLYCGQIFDTNAAVLLPRDERYLPALWVYCSSSEFCDAVRRIDRKVNVTNATLVKIPFDLPHWQQVARERFPVGLPKPHSTDPTQWLFNGHPRGSEHPLQVAVARLLGYRWPRQTGSSFMDCPALGPDGLESYADADGIVCLSPVKGEPPAADRLRALLAAAYGEEWSPDKQAELLAQVGYANKTLEDWFRDAFFEQHCELFHQRPFIWHIWDGLRNGFHALVNYHKLAGPNGEGRRTFEKLIYTYLGNWIDRQRVDQKAGIEGADGRLAAGQYLMAELAKILEGGPRYDIFVRWKPLHQQPIGWEPDINDGVRLNIRPFMTAKPLNGRGKTACILRITPKIKWEKDRGKEPHRSREDYPWFWGWDHRTENFAGGKDFDGNRWNDLHYSRAVKQAARPGREG